MLQAEAARDDAAAAAAEVIMGIDIGTTSVKVGAFTPDGTPRARYATAYPVARPRPGRVEQDPMDWWRCCVAGIRAVTTDLPAVAVRSIAVVGQVNTHLLVDEQLRPLAPAVVWQDQRCAEIATELDNRFTTAEKERLWGAPLKLDASFTGSRAAWFTRHLPEVWQRARWVLAPKDFVAALLTGEVATDGRTAGRLADRTGARYLAEAVGLVDGLAERLPPIADEQAVLGRVRDPDLGVGAPPVAVGSTDTFGDVYGTAVTRAGRAMVACGTSLVVTAASPRSVPTRGVATFAPRDGLYIHGGPTQAAGDALRWWGEVCARPVEEVLAGAARARPGAGGIVFTPHLAGERAPLWDARLRGTFLGLDAGTTQEDMSRAVLEGVAMSARQLLTAVGTAADTTLDPVMITGGGARSDLWAQTHADVLSRPVHRVRAPDSAVLGAALLGAVAAAVHPDVVTAAEAAVAVERVFIPDPAATARLEGLYEIYTDVPRALAGPTLRLAGWRADPN